jgi:hypothetical protein
MELDLLKSITENRKHTNSLQLLKNEVNKSLDRGKNVIIIVQGDTGSGKSTASLSLAAELDPIWHEKTHFAATTLTIFSALEFIILEGYLLKHGGEIYRRRFITVEEAESGVSGIAMAAAVQEFEKHIQVFRQWQINLILNLPFADDIPNIKNKVTHHIIWTIDIDEFNRIVLARWRQRVRFENKALFVNPYLKRQGIYDPSYPGAKLRIPFAHDRIWKAYQDEKQKFFIELNRKSYYRILRTSRQRSDLSVAIIRDHFHNLAEYIEKEDIQKAQELILKTEKAKKLKSSPEITAIEKAALVLYIEGGMTLRDLQRKIGKKWNKNVREQILESNYFKTRKRGRKDSLTVNLTEEGVKFVEELLNDYGF